VTAVTAVATDGQPTSGKRGWLARRQWGTAPDGFSIVIPASWEVPGAQAAPTIANWEGAEGGLRATRATVTQIATRGAELSAPLFRANGPRRGDPIGVAVGVYDIGMTNDLGPLRRAITEAVPDHLRITEVAVARITGLEVVRAPVEAPGVGRFLYTTDVWVEVPHRPRVVAVVRFWRVGSTWDDALGEQVAETFLFMVPGQFQGRLNRWALRRWGYFKPPDSRDLSAPEMDGCRAAGWRLGVVFHTAQLTDQMTMFFMNTERPKDALLGVAVLVAWIAVVVGFLADRTTGAGDWTYYLGSGPIFAFAQGLRRGRRSVLGLLATLGVAVAIGVAFR
jgi:hypothetical protein